MTNHIAFIAYSNFGWNAMLFNREDTPAFDTLVSNLTANTEVLTSDYHATNGNVYVLPMEEISGDNEDLLRHIGFRKCDICGKWVTPQERASGESTYENGVRRCPHCQQLHEAQQARTKKIRLAGYHQTEDRTRVINGEGETFDLSNVLGVGIEMEFNSGNGSAVRNGEINCTDEFYEDANPRSSRAVWRCERDGTVEGEIISNVFTKKALYAYDWTRLTNQLTTKLHNNEGVANVGFHVHLTKGFLGTTSKEQATNFLKLQYFLKCYEDDFLRMSGRKRNEMDWCRFYSMQDIERQKQGILACSDDVDAWRCVTSSHGYALISSGHTIELRIGKSTNDPKRIEMYLKFVLGIVENIKNVPSKKCYCLGKVTRLVPDDVMRYWRAKGCFTKTNAMETRGITL